MKRLLKDISAALQGLAYADAGEFMTQRQKLQFLNIDADGHAPLTTAAKRKRVLLAVAEQLRDDALRYALSICQRMEAGLDVLACSAAATRAVQAHLSVLETAGVDYRLLERQGPIKQEVATYLNEQAQVLFVVAGSSDVLKTELARKHDQTPVPGWGNFPLIVVADRS